MQNAKLCRDAWLSAPFTWSLWLAQVCKWTTSSMCAIGPPSRCLISVLLMCWDISGWQPCQKYVLWELVKAMLIPTPEDQFQQSSHNENKEIFICFCYIAFSHCFMGCSSADTSPVLGWTTLQVQCTHMCGEQNRQCACFASLGNLLSLMFSNAAWLGLICFPLNGETVQFTGGCKTYQFAKPDRLHQFF